MKIKFIFIIGLVFVCNFTQAVVWYNFNDGGIGTVWDWVGDTSDGGATLANRDFSYNASEVYEGDRGMKINYSCTNWVSYHRTLSSPENWSTYSGLTLWFRGLPGNSTNNLEVIVRQPDWTEIKKETFYNVTTNNFWTKFIVDFGTETRTNVGKVSFAVVGNPDNDWAFIDYIELIPEPTSVILFAAIGLFLFRKNK